MAADRGAPGFQLGHVHDLAPRTQILPTPYAIYAGNAAVAATATSVGANAVGTSGIQAGAVTSTQIANGTITTSDLSPTVLSNTFWGLGGNAGTTPGVNFVGTLDNEAVEVHVGVNGARGLRVEPDPVYGTQMSLAAALRTSSPGASATSSGLVDRWAMGPTPSAVATST